MSNEVEHLFTWHKPTPEQQAKYDSIRKGEVDTVLEFARASVMFADGVGERYAVVNDATRNFYLLVEALCPSSADRSAALRCIRIARMAKNEHLSLGQSAYPGEAYERVERIAIEQLMMARWQACAAIALASP